MILSYGPQKKQQCFCVAALGSAGTKQSSLYEHLGHFSKALIHLEIKTSPSSRHGSTSTARNTTFSKKKKKDNRIFLNFASPPWILWPGPTLYWLQMSHCCVAWGLQSWKVPSDWIFGENFCAAGFHFQDNKLQNASSVWWSIRIGTLRKVDVVGQESSCGLLGSVCVMLRCITWTAGDKWCHLFLSAWGVFEFEFR